MILLRQFPRVVRVSGLGQQYLRSLQCRSFHQNGVQGKNLTKLFDSDKYFINAQGTLHFANNVGLFRNEWLQYPEGLLRFSDVALQKAKKLVHTMLVEAKHTEDGRRTYIRKLDQLSDILCRVIDVAEFIRVVHPSQKWVEAAQQAHEQMFEYMNQLNTNVELYQMLVEVLELNVANELSNEEVEVGQYLRQDFERSGIAMDPETRDEFVAITQQISLLGAQYSSEIGGLERYWCSVPREEFENIADSPLKREISKVQRRAPSGPGIHIPVTGNLPYTVLTSCESQEIRKRVWIALHNSPARQVDILEAFLKYRALLAYKLGYRSFADYQLEHKMAKNPENVMTFLHNLQESLLSKKGGVVDELRTLYRHKHNPESASAQCILLSVKPWDRDFLMAREAEAVGRQGRKAELASIDTADIDEAHVPHLPVSDLPDISLYISVGTVMSGLDQLFRSIYNVALTPAKTGPGETWEQHVRKLSYVDLSTDEVLGHLYVDFWLAKVMPSHFTIVCLRELNLDIGSESASELQLLLHLNPAADYQLPVIALVCNFAKPKSGGIFDSDCPTLLTLDQLDTIFHEMGHATHLMLGRTRLHNLSGTRCLTDFVELPSVLMELFSLDTRVLSRILRHHNTGEPVPEDLLKSHLARRDALRNTETYMQSKMAVLDQRLHDDQVFPTLQNGVEFDSTAVYHAVERELRVFSDEYLTWHAKFPHLFSYGAVYYSYLLDRAIAEKIWAGVFAKDPWSREAGEKYRMSILRWGGTRDPWHCVADALNEPELRKGDARAMEIIANV